MMHTIYLFVITELYYCRSIFGQIPISLQTKHRGRREIETDTKLTNELSEQESKWARKVYHSKIDAHNIYPKGKHFVFHFHSEVSNFYGFENITESYKRMCCGKYHHSCVNLMELVPGLNSTRSYMLDILMMFIFAFMGCVRFIFSLPRSKIKLSPFWIENYFNFRFGFDFLFTSL